jgi:hypothetical protein
MSENRLTDERIAYLIDANSTAYVEPEGFEMALEIRDSRAVIARVEALVVDLQSSGWSEIVRIAFRLKAALRGEAAS